MSATRRTLLLGATALVPLAMAGCATQTQTQLQADVTLIAHGLAGLSAALAALPGNPVPAATLAKVNAEIAVIETDAAAIASAATPQTNVVTGIAAAITAIVPLATPFFPAAPLVAGVLNAALALLPPIFAAAGIAAAPLNMPTPTMSAAQARLILARGV